VGAASGTCKVYAFNTREGLAKAIYEVPVEDRVYGVEMEDRVLMEITENRTFTVTIEERELELAA
jgi:hypothetical protein